MKVRLTKKLAETLDGVDVSRNRVGDVLDLPPMKARLLVAEEWATAAERRHETRPVHVDRRHQLSHTADGGQGDADPNPQPFSKAADLPRRSRQSGRK